MKRELMVQLILLGVALLAMVIGIVFTRDMEAVHNETLIEVLSANAKEVEAEIVEPAPDQDAPEPQTDPAETVY